MVYIICFNLFSIIKNYQVFDPTLKKKKKKKKTTFDIDAAFNEGGSGGDTSENIDKENQEPESTVVEDDEALDLENFGKKKKKKKKAFNLDELEAVLPDTKKEVKTCLKTFYILINLIVFLFIINKFLFVLVFLLTTGPVINF